MSRYAICASMGADANQFSHTRSLLYLLEDVTTEAE